MRPLLRCLSFVLPVVVVALAPGRSAHAADWTYREPLNRVPVSPTGFMPARDGIWTYDLQTARFTDATGATQAVVRNLALGGGVIGDIFSAGYVTRDGGAILSTGCTLQRIEPDRRASWRYSRFCTARDANADGIVWINADQNLLQLGPDGVTRTVIAFEPPVRIDAVAALADGGVLALSRHLLPSQVAVSRFDAQGVRRWEWSGAEALGQAIVPMFDDGAFVFGMSGGVLSMSRLDAQGHLVGTQTNTVEGSTLLGVRRTPRGAFVVVSGASAGGVDRPQNLHYVKENGDLVWSRAVCPQLPLTALAYGMPDLAIDDDDTVVNFCPPGATSARGGRLLYRHLDGSETTTSIPLAHGVQLRRERNRVVLLLARPSAANTDGAKLFIIPRSGTLLTTEIEGVSETAPRELLAAVRDSDGSRYLLSQAALPSRGESDQILSKLGPDGVVAWRTPIPSFAVREATVRIGQGRVCIAEHADITAVNRYPTGRSTCLLAANGRVISRSETALGQFGEVRSRPVAGGKMVHVTMFANHYTVRVDRADGTPEGVSQFNGPITDAAIDGQGRTTVIGGGMLRQYDIARSEVYAVPLQVDGMTLSIVGTEDAGGAYVHGAVPGQPGSTTRLWALAPDGSTRWLIPVEGPITRATALVTTDDVYLLQYTANAGSLSEGTILKRIRRSDGALRWRYDSSNPSQGGMSDALPEALALNASGSAIVLANTWGDHLRMEHIDSGTGVRMAERIADCERFCTRPAAVALDAAGVVTMATTLAAADGDQGAALLTAPGFDGARKPPLTVKVTAASPAGR